MLKKFKRQITIRKAANRDIEPLIKLQESIFQEDLPWNRQILQKELNKVTDSLYLVLYRGSKLIAFIGAKFYAKETHVSNILVAPKFQQRHLGTDLLQFIINLAKLRADEYVSLEVSTENKVAQKMYHSLGFRKMFVRKNYYANETDAINMIRFLNE